MSWRICLAWLVHLYTAFGAVVGFFTIVSIERGNVRQTLFLMALAVVIDATDGTLARYARVKDLIPWFDGDLLDNLADYFNYVIVPCLFLLRLDLLPTPDAWWLAPLPLIASAYGFCQKNAKTADYFFLGFPSYWNVLVFYLYTLKTALWLNAFLVIGLSALVFVPIRFIYPSRTPRFRFQTNVLGGLWALAIFYTIYSLPNASTTLVFVTLIFPTYYAVLSVWLEFLRITETSRRG